MFRRDRKTLQQSAEGNAEQVQAGLREPDLARIGGQPATATPEYVIPGGLDDLSRRGRLINLTDRP